MAKLRYEVIPDMEQRIITELTPVIEGAYDAHIMGGARFGMDKGSDFSIGTINPLAEMYKAAGLEQQEIITPELCDAVSDSYQDHVDMYLDLGLDVRPAVKLAGGMNLSTEDNIIWYHGKQYSRFGENDAYVELLSRWSTEEYFHGPFISLWGQFTGAISSNETHRNDVYQMMGGIHVPVDSIVSTNAFTDPQEADTFDAHNNLGKPLDPIGRKVMNTVARQELRHRNMFRIIGQGIYQLGQEFTDYALPIEAETHRRFAMPAEQSLPNFADAAAQIAAHGLFTLEGVLKRQEERVNDLGLLELKVGTEAAKKAQDTIAKTVDPTSRVNIRKARMLELVTERYIEQEKDEGRIPFILGRTAVVEKGKMLVVPEAT